MPRIAFMTFGVLYEPRAHARSKGFIDRIPDALAEAERSEGFIAHSHLDTATGLHSWGELVCPQFLAAELHPNVARTLSLWSSLESVFAYSYAGLHKDAITQREQWFRKREFPNHVIWWVPDDHVPNFIESTARLEHCTPAVLVNKRSTSNTRSIRSAIPRPWIGCWPKRLPPEMPCETHNASRTRSSPLLHQHAKRHRWLQQRAGSLRKQQTRRFPRA